VVIVCVAVALLGHFAHDKKAIQGTWKEVSVEVNGEMRSGDYDWDFGSEYLDNYGRSRYILNPISNTIEWGPDWDRVACTYELNGNTLKIRTEDGERIFFLERVAP